MGKLGVFNANQTSMCLVVHLNEGGDCSCIMCLLLPNGVLG